MGKAKVRLDKDLMEKIKKYVKIAGYSSAEEFITHCLEKELAKLEQERTRVTSKLANENYVSRAPAEVVARERARLEDIVAAIARLGEQRTHISRLQ